MMKRRTLLGGMGLLALPMGGLLSGCGGGDDDDDAQLRLLNASTGYTSLDLDIDDDEVSSAVALGGIGDYVSLDPETVDAVLRRSTSSTTLLTREYSLSSGKSYTMLAYGSEGDLSATLITEDDDKDDLDNDQARFRLFNAAPDAGELDLYLTGEDDSLTDASPVASSVNGGSSSSFTDLDTGTYRLRITGADDKDDLRLDVSGVLLSSEQVATFIAVGSTAGGVLVDGLMLTQKGELESFASAAARVRVVAAVEGNAVVSASADGAALVSGVTSPTLGNYVRVASGSLSLAVTVNGSALDPVSLDVAAGSDWTVLVHSASSSAQVSSFADDNRLPTGSNKAQLRLVNGMADAVGALTLTLDYLAVASSVASASASTSEEVSVGSDLTLQVSSPSLGTLLTLTDVTLSTGNVYSLFMFGSAASPVGQLVLEHEG